jgi:hypothetical protein
LTLVPLSYRFKDTVTEQRKNQRFSLRLPFQIVGSGTNIKTSGETMNVSSSGVLFTSKDRVPLGDPIEYVIAFPKAPGSRSDVRLRCVGKVVREDTESAYAATLERYEFVRKPA